jgi:RNA-splicing ligase RtcB
LRRYVPGTIGGLNGDAIGPNGQRNQAAPVSGAAAGRGAGAGVVGIISGSMGTPGYVVRGKGVAAAQTFLRERGVTLLSAGLDEVPMADKNIDEVMAAQ